MVLAQKDRDSSETSVIRVDWMQLRGEEIEVVFTRTHKLIPGSPDSPNHGITFIKIDYGRGVAPREMLPAKIFSNLLLRIPLHAPSGSGGSPKIVDESGEVTE